MTTFACSASYSIPKPCNVVVFFQCLDHHRTFHVVPCARCVHWHRTPSLNIEKQKKFLLPSAPLFSISSFPYIANFTTGITLYGCIGALLHKNNSMAQWRLFIIVFSSPANCCHNLKVFIVAKRWVAFRNEVSLTS